MSVEEAIKTIRDPNATFVECVKAAEVLAQSSNAPLEYLLECLKRKGLCAETAAIRLYTRTKRPRSSETIEGVVLDYDNWFAYLREQKLI